MTKMVLLNPMDTDTGIEWWDECRKQANKAIDKYNLWQLGEAEAQEVYVQFALSYLKTSQRVTDYSEIYDVIYYALQDEGFDVSFYTENN